MTIQNFKNNLGEGETTRIIINLSAMVSTLRRSPGFGLKSCLSLPDLPVNRRAQELNPERTSTRFLKGRHRSWSMDQSN